MSCMIGLAGCSLVNEDLQECPAELNVRFIYDYNLKFSNAFSKEVKSVNVWAFDEKGALVWSGAASGPSLADENFKLETPLTEGTYDFVSWCGLEDNADFNLGTYSPVSREELEVKLATVANEGAHVSKSMLPGLFHGCVMAETFTVDPNKPSIKTVTMPLMKDTNNIRVLLQRYDGSEISENEFEVFITIPDAWLAWNNDVLPDGPLVTYKPWNIKYGTVTLQENENRAETVTSVSALLFEMSSSRLIANSKATLTVRRTSDNKDIIRIPVIDYFLMVKGHYLNPDGTPLTDQQYLDYQDDYSILFFIDEDNNWFTGNGIYINSWVVVPPQQDIL